MNIDDDGTENAGNSVNAARRAVERAEVKLADDLSRASAAGAAELECLVARARPLLIGGAVLAAAAGVAALVWRGRRRRGVVRVPAERSLVKEVTRAALLSLASAAARRYGERLFAGPRSIARRGVTAGAAALLLMSAAPARAAETKAGVDVGAAFPSSSVVSSDGWGAGLRFGREYRFTLLTLTPELDLAYHRFGDSGDASAVRFLGGGRVGIDFGLEPGVFAHAGVGHFSAPRGSNTSLGYDLGAALDLTLLPVVSFGPHVMLAGVAGSDSTTALDWVEVGGHVSFSFRD